MHTDKAAAQGPGVFVAPFSPPNRDLHLAFEELTLPLFGPLHNFARWISRDPHEAEDLVQETYLKALRTFPSLRDGSNVRAWMFKILENTFFNVRSRLDRRMTARLSEHEDFAELAIDDETPEAALMKSIDRELVHRLIGQLPSHFRDVLLLCHIEEMSYQEIADNLAIPIGTVMSRLSRARRLMRGSLGTVLSQ